jgi:hypothetical protein
VSGATRLTHRERKAWALREGHPLWLWPEVAPAAWRSAMSEFERVCRALLAGDRPEPIRGDPAAISLAGYTSGMGPMLGWWLGHGALPGSSAAIDQALGQQLEANRARMTGLLDRARAVVRLMTGQGLGVTVLKGAATALAYFPEPACRPMSDIDVLVPETDAACAAALIEAAGYRRIAGNRFESTWRLDEVAVSPLTSSSLEADDPWTLDLHVSLDILGPPGATPARLSRLDPDSTRTAWAPVPAARRLSQPALLLHLAAHAGSGFHNLTLVRLVEIVLVARADREAGALDWETFERLGREAGALAFAFPALHLARELAPADIPQEAVALCRAAAPRAVTRLVAGLRPATAHRIERPSLREHFAWTGGPAGWLRRLAADILPEPRSLRRSATIHAARARGLLRATPPLP